MTDIQEINRNQSNPSISHGVGVPLEEGRDPDPSSVTCWATIICDAFWSLQRLTAIFTLNRHGARPWPVWKSRGQWGNNCLRAAHQCRGMRWGSAHTAKHGALQEAMLEGREHIRGEGGGKAKWPWKDCRYHPLGGARNVATCFFVLTGWIKTDARHYANLV